jgi:hypothetical protein
LVDARRADDAKLLAVPVKPGQLLASITAALSKCQDSVVGHRRRYRANLRVLRNLVHNWKRVSSRLTAPHIERLGHQLPGLGKKKIPRSRIESTGVRNHNLLSFL